MKKFLKNLVATILGWQVRRLRRKNVFKVVAVAGSVGKTSTKLAIAQVLAQKYSVRYQKGNYNDLVSVPLIFFGQKLPSLYNPVAWLIVFWKNEAVLRKKYPFEVVVTELGTDKPGDMSEFKRYIQADLGVLTGITPEHMEYFTDLNAVAKEELVLAELSNELLINEDLVESEFIGKLKASIMTYGAKTAADYRISNIKFAGRLSDFDISRKQTTILRATHEAISEPQLLSVCAAVAVGDQLSMTAEEIEKGISQIKPVSGRMRRLEGINSSVIIDDTYNASPEAVKAALDTLYRMNSPHKIAILGNMNELGVYSQKLHEEIGQYCDPNEVDLVATIGPDANRFLAPEAEAQGCKVQSFDDPYSAAEHLKPLIKKDAIVLVKGSQNGVFAEETVKLLLANPADARLLVRQSKTWLKAKHKAFGQ